MNQKPVWYIRDVRKKKNKDWSPQERNHVYTLRVEENKSVKEIIKIMGGGLTKNQIHNQVRIEKKARVIKCFTCGHKLKPSELKSKHFKGIYCCKKCKKELIDYKKKRRKKALKKGLCGVCYHRPKFKNHTACKVCLSTTYRRRISKGYCGLCGKNKLFSKALCISCLLDMRNNPYVNRNRAQHA